MRDLFRTQSVGERSQPIDTSPRDEALKSDSTARQRGIEVFHIEVSDALSAADFRLDKAHGLGHDLAETWLTPEDGASFDAAFGPRVVEVKNAPPPRPAPSSRR